MKHLIGSLLAVFLLLVFSSRVFAQYVTNDSANGQVIELIPGDFADPGIIHPKSAEGPPDNDYATIPSISSILDMGFRRDTNSGWLPILKGSILKIYGSGPQGSNDSVAASVTFFRGQPLGVVESDTQHFIATKGVTTITVDSNYPDYTYVEFTLTGGGHTVGSQIFLLDAITLIEPFGSISVAQEIKPQVAGLLGNYPNPFSTSSGTNFKMHLNRAGSAELVVYDAIGREVSRNNMGYLSPGDFTSTFKAAAPGVYFARLLLNSAPYGAMLKMTSIR